MSESYKGIDISFYQGDVDFTKIKRDFDFVLLRSSYGNLTKYPNQIDNKFRTNVQKANAVGINWGVYHYSYFTTVEVAKEEARGFVKLLNEVKPIPHIVTLDIEEGTQASLSTAQLESCVKAFMDIVEGAGYFCALYSYESFLAKFSKAFRDKYTIWCANINGEPSINYDIWQYSFVGKVDGIKGDVDMDKTLIDFHAVIKEAGLNGYNKNESKKPVAKEDKAISPFDEYFKKNLGVAIDYDGSCGVTCFDLANDYSVKVIGGKAFTGNSAFEIYTNFANQPGKELYERIANTPEFVPIKGDIIVWGNGIGKWGHVAVCSGEGDTTWFKSYEQNWTGNHEPVELLKHDYHAILGVLRPKDQSKILGKVAENKAGTNGNAKTDNVSVGDVNGDGVIDIEDVVALTNHINGVKPLGEKKTEKKSETPQEKKTIEYTVQSRDTLSKIAEKYGTTWQKIANENGLKNPDLIFVGQKLNIS